jgi:hypothetical protein
MGVMLVNEPDSFVWKLSTSVKSIYTNLMNDDARFLIKYLWKLKNPLKIKIFMWFLNKKVLLTRDNLAKRNLNGSKKCCFCECEPSFLSCPFARLVWRIIFAKYDIPPPTNITNMFGNWLNGIDIKTKR